MYDGNTVILELDGNGAEKARNVYGRNLIARESDGEKAIYRYNGHGDVITIMGTDGTAISSYEYDEFGNETASTGTFDNPYRYAGYEYLDEVELYDLNARYYDPSIARFLTEDPYYNLGNRVMGVYEINVPNVYSIMQANALYAYCGNSPVIHMDLRGLDAILINKKVDVLDGNTPVDHMSALFEDENGDWYYFFWGETVIYNQIEDDSALESLENLNEYLAEKGFINDVEYYTSVYIKGDFTASHDAASALKSAYDKQDWERDSLLDIIPNFINEKLEINNADYRLLTNNCSQVTMELFYMGTLPSGENVGDYSAQMKNFGLISVLPNANMSNMQDIFYNKAFTEEEFEEAIKIQEEKYVNKPWYVQLWHWATKEAIDKIK